MFQLVFNYKLPNYPSLRTGSLYSSTISFLSSDCNRIGQLFKDEVDDEDESDTSSLVSGKRRDRSMGILTSMNWSIQASWHWKNLFKCLTRILIDLFSWLMSLLADSWSCVSLKSSLLVAVELRNRMESDHFIKLAREPLIRVRYALNELELVIRFVLVFIFRLFLVMMDVSKACMTLYMSRTVSKMAVILDAMISYFFFKIICSKYLMAFENLSTHLFSSYSCFVCIHFSELLLLLTLFWGVPMLGVVLFRDANWKFRLRLTAFLIND